MTIRNILFGLLFQIFLQLDSLTPKRISNLLPWEQQNSVGPATFKFDREKNDLIYCSDVRKRTSKDQAWDWIVDSFYCWLSKFIRSSCCPISRSGVFTAHLLYWKCRIVFQNILKLPCHWSGPNVYTQLWMNLKSLPRWLWGFLLRSTDDKWTWSASTNISPMCEQGDHLAKFTTVFKSALETW